MWKQTPWRVLFRRNKHDLPDISRSMRRRLTVWDELSIKGIPDEATEPINFEDSTGRRVFWHSAAHILGQVRLLASLDGVIC